MASATTLCLEILPLVLTGTLSIKSASRLICVGCVSFRREPVREWLPTAGGVCLDLSEMNEVLSVNTEDMDCRVQAPPRAVAQRWQSSGGRSLPLCSVCSCDQRARHATPACASASFAEPVPPLQSQGHFLQAGVRRLQLNQELRHSGLCFPIDPGADASLGGMVACGASGTAAVKYGTMRENTFGLTAVLASGEIVHTGGRARKSRCVPSSPPLARLPAARDTPHGSLKQRSPPIGAAFVCT